MGVEWGPVTVNELELIEPGDVEDYAAAGQLETDEVALLSCQAALYGTRGQMLALADRIVRKWGPAAQQGGRDR